jgi:undecaprenyl diphosphate synthase
MKNYTPEEEKLKKSILDCGNIPQHIAIIMDGNGRWAKSKNLKRIDGHMEGINSVRAVVEASGDLGIRVVTFYTFSTENWKRPPQEVSALWKLLINTVRNEVPELKKNNVRLMVSGLIEQLPVMTRKSVLYAIDALKQNTGLIVNLALNYSSRQELTLAFRKIAQEIKAGKMDIDAINEELISEHLFTHGLPDPDFVIRTSGEFRVSNFLLWQIAYSELYVTDTYWPDFRKEQYFQAIRSYQSRERRFGLLSEQICK